MGFRLKDIDGDIKRKCPSCKKRRVMRGIIVDDIFVGQSCATCRDKYLFEKRQAEIRNDFKAWRKSNDT